MSPRRTIMTTTALAAGLLLVGQAPLAVGAEHVHSPPGPQATDEGDARGAGKPESKPERKYEGKPGGKSGAESGGERSARGEGRDERRGAKSGRGGHGHEPEPVPLTDEQVQEAIVVMIDLDPAMAPRIEKLRAQRPEQLRREVSHRFPRLGYMLELRESQPALYALRVKDTRLQNLSKKQARALAALPEGDPGVDAARAVLRGTLQQHFTVRQDLRRVELAALREKLVQMEARLGQGESRREAIIEKRLAHLEANPPMPAAGGALDRRRGPQGQGARAEGTRGEGPRGEKDRHGGHERDHDAAK